MKTLIFHLISFGFYFLCAQRSALQHSPSTERQTVGREIFSSEYQNKFIINGTGRCQIVLDTLCLGQTNESFAFSQRQCCKFCLKITVSARMPIFQMLYFSFDWRSLNFKYEIQFKEKFDFFY